MIDYLSGKISDAQVRNPYWFLIVFGIVTLILIPGLFNLVSNVEPSLEKVLPQDIEEVQTMNDMRTQFGADMMYLLVYSEGSVVDVRNPQFLNYLDSLEQKIRVYDGILIVQGFVDEV